MEDLVGWLVTTVLPHERTLDRVRAAVDDRCRELRLEPPAPRRLERLVNPALATYERRVAQAVHARLSPASVAALDGLLTPTTTDQTAGEAARAPLVELKTDPGPAGLESVLTEIAKLQRLRAIQLPPDLFAAVPPKARRGYGQRVHVEEPYELRRHPAQVRSTLLAAWTRDRTGELTDNLVETLIQTIKCIDTTAQHRVEQEILADFRRVTGTAGLLFRVAEASVERLDGIVREVVFPAVGGEHVLHELVKEYRATGPGYRRKLHQAMRRSYQAHYRRLLPLLLDTLSFRSNNEAHQPIIQAVDLLKRYAASKARTFPAEEVVSIRGVVRPGWRELVVEHDKQGRERVNCISYVLQAVRARVRCKEVWVDGADRYRNPDDDLPADFGARREAYYQDLGQPLDADAFISALQREMADALAMLDRELPTNPDVRIVVRSTGKSAIRLSPLTGLPEPPNLIRLKLELGRR